MPRHKQLRLSQTKTAIQHCDTNITTTGGGSNPAQFNILETSGGNRSLAGAEKTIKSSSTTGEIVNVGDIVKYVNLFIQSAPRSTATTPAESMGYVEWALVMVKESDQDFLITNVGTLTLGCIATNMYRNECIYTGNMPVGLNQPNSQSIVIKVPKFKQKIRLGDEWRFVHWFRSWDSTNDDLNNVKTVKSFMYKCYS